MFSKGGKTSVSSLSLEIRYNFAIANIKIKFCSDSI